jgi:hypothetical protein
MASTADLYLLHLTSRCGVETTAGPLPLIEAMRVVDAHVLPYGWQHRFRQVVAIDDAIAYLSMLPPKQPVPGHDLLVALRRAILCAPGLDGADDPRTRHLLTHVDVHRPLQLWTGPEECLLGECEHDERGTGRRCPDVIEAEQLCVACSVIHDSGSEYGPEHLLPVPWPCSVIHAAADRFQVTHPAGTGREPAREGRRG